MRVSSNKTICSQIGPIGEADDSSGDFLHLRPPVLRANGDHLEGAEEQLQQRQPELRQLRHPHHSCFHHCRARHPHPQPWRLYLIGWRCLLVDAGVDLPCHHRPGHFLR